MTSQKTGLDGCERCPACYLVPTVKYQTEFITQTERVVLECEKHGHMAMGDTIEMAVKNWDVYLHFYTKATVA